MLILVAGLLVFFSVHLYSAFRSRGEGGDIRVRLGHGPYMGVYSLLAGIGLALIIWGFDAARPAMQLYSPPVWGRHLNYLLMLVALVALAAAYLPKGYIAKVLKHPMLVAVKLWAFGHLLANGELNSVLLFGAFLVYAVIDRIAVKRRGDSGAGVVAVPRLLGDVLAVGIGTVAYLAILFWLHPVLFGAVVWPMA